MIALPIGATYPPAVESRKLGFEATTSFGRTATALREKRGAKYTSWASARRNRSWVWTSSVGDPGAGAVSAEARSVCVDPVAGDELLGVAHGDLPVAHVVVQAVLEAVFFV